MNIVLIESVKNIIRVHGMDKSTGRGTGDMESQGVKWADEG